MIKLIVSDLDGTLLPYGETELSKEIISLIEKAIHKNINFAVSSGRTYGELLGFLHDFEDSVYFISCDGACTIKNGKVVAGKSIAAENFKMFTVTGAPVVFHGAFENYIFGDAEGAAGAFSPKRISNIYEIREKIYKISLFSKPIDLPQYSSLRLHWHDSTNTFIQYVNRFADKGSALADLQMRLSSSNFETACLGDEENDIAMMNGAKRSFCIGSSCMSLKNVCTDYAVSGADALRNIIEEA